MKIALTTMLLSALMLLLMIFLFGETRWEGLPWYAKAVFALSFWSSIAGGATAILIAIWS